MRSRLLVFAAIFLLSVTMNSCQKSEAFIKDDPKQEVAKGMGMPKTLVQTSTLMDGELSDDQTIRIEMAAREFVMIIEQIGHPSIDPFIIIGCNVIYLRGDPMYRLKKKEEEI